MPEFNSGGSTSGPAGMGARRAQYTGAYIVLLDPRNQKSGLTALRSGARLGEAQSAWASDVARDSGRRSRPTSPLSSRRSASPPLLPPSRTSGRRWHNAAESPNVLAVERERVVYAFDALSPDYLRGDSSAIHPGELVFHP